MKKQFVFLFYALLTATTLFSFTGKSIAADPTPIALPKDLPADLKLPDNEIVFFEITCRRNAKLYLPRRPGVDFH